MTILYFFGDSWPAEGGEINAITRTDVDSIPTMVGKQLNLPIVNLAVSGSSQPFMLHQLLNSDIKPSDHAVFCLTAPSRRFYYNEQGHPVNKSSYEYLQQEAVNDFNDNYNSVITCYTLYQYCLAHGIQPWFINMFNISQLSEHKLWNEIPDQHWIIAKDSCVVKLFDPAFFSRYATYHNSDFQDWLDTKNAQVQKYIFPCENHPNEQGRKLIAETISLKLSAANNTSAG